MPGAAAVIKAGALGSVGGGDATVCRALDNRGCDSWRGTLEDRVHGIAGGQGTDH